jgi:hypothetical protein
MIYLPKIRDGQKRKEASGGERNGGRPGPPTWTGPLPPTRFRIIRWVRSRALAGGTGLARGNGLVRGGRVVGRRARDRGRAGRGNFADRHRRGRALPLVAAAEELVPAEQPTASLGLAGRGLGRGRRGWRRGRGRRRGARRHGGARLCALPLVTTGARVARQEQRTDQAGESRSQQVPSHAGVSKKMGVVGGPHKRP